MPKPNPTIRVEHLAKKYRVGARAPYKTLRDSLMGLWPGAGGNGRREDDAVAKRSKPADSFWALDDISFEVNAGEVLGIIGRNGAGKSTLLKILSRITEPTRGRIEINGRVGSLLEVGTGFHPELTGRENVFLNGAILGMKRGEIVRQFDAIVDFAGIESFLDTPVKHYSSGMYTRLAFAVAAHLEPEILIVDEVLAVGDAEFQRKCIGKMRNVAGQGRTVLFVSHQMDALRSLCPRAILLQSGQIAEDGPSGPIISRYMLGGDGQCNRSEFVGACAANKHIELLRFAAVDDAMTVLGGPRRSDERVGVLLEVNVLQPHRALNLGFALYAGDGALLFWSLTTDPPEQDWPPLSAGMHRLAAYIPEHLLNEGDYRVELIASLHHSEWISQPGNNAPSFFFQVRGGFDVSPFWLHARPGLLAPMIPFLPINTTAD